ncbi:glyoxylase-like metal-dependent hydrolase (beta-lactamase superfamily II) [Kribbella aluminosa]|uniref:Glyoxylase-like metal-dependent hydrolase (Beta-lactamase superfamily II) n=1 Tax=Kribbella aluminosa TaxID=416017 RepID=A0ABS4UY01_9ACTN|nr:MBL fold metallo-hydrolase [Kribbella aluminosa]MBP2356512.1 glyoxylase-like metal-dependent hydrolase (beta-lactamase superfamily II) [Kribbella aluminosa]
MSWTELGDRTWVRRYDEWDLNVGLVVGADGALVIDTRATAEEAEQLRDHIRELTGLPVKWVVNTHAHFDHVVGNSVFTDAEVYLHENAATEQNLAGTTFAAAKVVDLGDRRVELLHVGNGHTSGDTVVAVPDVEVFFVGDLLEESAPPSYGEDSFPLEWPDTIQAVVGMMPLGVRIVPGHGAVVDLEFARDQAIELGRVANTISTLHHAGTSLDDALEHTEDWPWPVDKLQDAIRRGYAALGTPKRPSLPLLGPG